MNFRACVVCAAIAASPAWAQEDTESLAKAAQNLLAPMISLPVQNEMGFDYGPTKELRNVVGFQPVIPVGLSTDWNLITRTIVPLVSQPGLTEYTVGIGNINFTAFLSPANPGALIWGVGPVITFPSATSPQVGSQSTWGVGPSLVLVTMPGHWVIGVLASNVWSIAGDTANNLLVQYFVNFNLPEGWYLQSSPIITADWEASPGNKWLVPFGGGLGKIFRIAKLPFNGGVSAFWNAVKPDVGPDWTLRLQLALLLPDSVL
ncbi:MAG TPA: neuromedin U [Myxococcales bacterium]|nr:neuromedin U [Myxococcales bacterium]